MGAKDSAIKSSLVIVFLGQRAPLITYYEAVLSTARTARHFYNTFIRVKQHNSFLCTYTHIDTSLLSNGIIAVCQIFSLWDGPESTKKSE
jgi:hypothetical protein